VLKKVYEDTEIPNGLIINLLIDGEDPLESLMKSICYLWAEKGFSSYMPDVMTILQNWTPFTSLSRVCLSDTCILNQTIHKGDGVLGILVIPENLSENRKIMAFGAGNHCCLGEGIAMRVANVLYNYLNGKNEAYLEKFETNDFFWIFHIYKNCCKYKTLCI
jgi:hypothetical protein